MTELDPQSAAATEHAPAQRASEQQIRKLSERALSSPILNAVFDAVGGCAVVLDRHRQIIAASDTTLSLLGSHCGSTILGARPGEALNCINASRGPNGCGTSIQCRHCGAVAAILAAQVADHPIDGQCTISSGNPTHPRIVDYKLRISPLLLGGERAYLMVLQDVTAVKWHELLESMFLHDLANMVTGLQGWTDEMQDGTTAEAATQVLELVHRLGESLANHRELLLAESSKIRVSSEPISFERLAEDLRRQFGAHACANGRQLTIENTAAPDTLTTDRELLTRVLANLIKNAFEASKPHTQVTLSMRTIENATAFEVHNHGVIPDNIVEMLFKRRFSTKGLGRGLGIYTVQVFGEHYLGGHVSFTSTEQTGTVFRLMLPNTPRTSLERL